MVLVAARLSHQTHATEDTSLVLSIELDAVGNLATKAKLGPVEGLKAKQHLHIVEDPQKVNGLHRLKGLVVDEPN